MTNITACNDDEFYGRQFGWPKPAHWVLLKNRMVIQILQSFTIFAKYNNLMYIATYNDLMYTFISKATHNVYWNPVTYTRSDALDHHRFRQWLFAFLAPSLYLNQCWIIVNHTLVNTFCEIWIKMQTFDSVNIISYAFANVVCEAVAIC